MLSKFIFVQIEWDITLLWSNENIFTVVFPTFHNCFAHINFDSNILLATCIYAFLNQSSYFL